MTKRRRHAESGERVDGANHKRAKVEDSTSTLDVGFIDLVGSGRPSKTNKTRTKEQKAPLQGSRKSKHERRAMKKAQEGEQAGMGEKCQRNKTKKEDGEAITLSNSGNALAEKEESEVGELSEDHDLIQHLSKKSKSKRKRSKKSKVRSTNVEEAGTSENAFKQAVIASRPEWNVARPTGGQMLDVDPVFSEDEE